MQKRKAELDAIFKKLYEDSVLGRGYSRTVPDARCQLHR